MEFHVEWIDVTQNLATGHQPVFFIKRTASSTEAKAWAGQTERAKLGEFWVPHADPRAEMDPKKLWSYTREGDMVRVPVHAYRTTTRSMAMLWAMGMQVALAALNKLRDVTADKPIKTILVLGHDVTDLYPEDAFRGYVGIAFQTK